MSLTNSCYSSLLWAVHSVEVLRTLYTCLWDESSPVLPWDRSPTLCLFILQKSRRLSSEARLSPSINWESVSQYSLSSLYLFWYKAELTCIAAAGIMISYWLCYGTSFIGGQACDANAQAEFGGSTFNPYTDVPEGGCTGQKALAWRLPLILQTVPSAILMIATLWLPFSPRWLMSQGREQEARTIISKIRALPEDDAIVEIEWLEIKAAVIFDERTAAELHPGKKGYVLGLAKVGMLFTNKGLFKRLFMGCVLMVFQQFTGINAII